MKKYFINSFKPILNDKTIALIIGTMPSEESLNQGKYYANERNLFWPFIKEIYGIDRYDYNALLKHRIGLWDALKSCQRKGSVDSNIKEKEYNDFSNYSQIKYFIFTSKNAYKFFTENKPNKKLLKKDNYFVLPSPSPTYARMPKEEKFKIWQKCFKNF